MAWVVFYYIDEDGCCEIEDFLNNLKEGPRGKVTAWIDKLEEQGPQLPRPFADTLEDGIHELRIKVSGRQTRILYFFVFRTYIILTHDFIKNDDKVPPAEIKKAKRIRDEFKSRFKKLETFKKYLKELEEVK